MNLESAEVVCPEFEAPASYSLSELRTDMVFCPIYESLVYDFTIMEQASAAAMQAQLMYQVNLSVTDALESSLVTKFGMLLSKSKCFETWNLHLNLRQKTKRERHFLSLFKKSEIQDFCNLLPNLDQVVKEREQKRSIQIMIFMKRSNCNLITQKVLGDIVQKAILKSIQKTLFAAVPLVFASAAGIIALVVFYRFMDSLLQ